jgi:hypothetical protein
MLHRSLGIIIFNLRPDYKRICWGLDALGSTHRYRSNSSGYRSARRRKRTARGRPRHADLFPRLFVSHSREPSEPLSIAFMFEPLTEQMHRCCDAQSLAECLLHTG